MTQELIWALVPLLKSYLKWKDSCCLLKRFNPPTPQENDQPLFCPLCCVPFTSAFLNDLSDGASLLAGHDQDVLQPV